MDLFVTILVQFIGVGVPVAALLGHLLNASISKWKLKADEDLERIRRQHSEQLEVSRHEAAHQLEKLRSELRGDAYRNEILFSRLHEKKVVVLAELFGELMQAYTQLRLWGGTLRRGANKRTLVSAGVTAQRTLLRAAACVQASLLYVDPHLAKSSNDVFQLIVQQAERLAEASDIVLAGGCEAVDHDDLAKDIPAMTELLMLLRWDLHQELWGEVQQPSASPPAP